MSGWNFQDGPSGPISMVVYDRLQMLENFGLIRLELCGIATEAERAENRWYLDQQGADPESYTSDATDEELRAVLTTGEQ